MAVQLVPLQTAPVTTVSPAQIDINSFIGPIISLMTMAMLFGLITPLFKSMRGE